MHITLIMAYYDNPKMLKQQLDNIAAYSEEIRNSLEIIIVDDCSPRWPAREVISNHSREGIKVRLFRTKVDVPWNQDFCRNLGVSQAKTPWILLTDIDHLVPESTMHELVSNEYKPYVVYKFSRISAPEYMLYKPHPNSWFMSREFYETMGGYDERFAGWYGTDGDFRDRITRLTYIELLPWPLIRVPREVIADASTTTLIRKSPENGAMIAKIKNEREKDYKPKTLSFPWEEVQC